MNSLFKSILYAICCCFCYNGLASGTAPLPVRVDYSIENTTFHFKVLNDLYIDYFVDAYFEDENTNLFLQTKYTVTFLEILNEDYELECKIPVFTSNLHLNLETFSKGKYLLLLFVQGEPFPIATVFTKK